MVKLRSRFEGIWIHPWAGFVLIIICITVAACLFHWVPSPGVSVGVMGVVAVVVSLRTRASGAEKAVWILLILAFLAIEIKAIKRDRILNAAEQKRQSEEERKRLSDIDQRAKNGFEESIKTTTGGDSYCYLYEPSPTGSIILTCPGKYPLYELEVHAFDAATQKAVWETRLKSMPAKTFKGIAGHLAFGVNRQDFIVLFEARNGFWTELLHYRKIRDAWVHAELVYRSPSPEYPKGVFLSELVDSAFPREELKQDDEWTT